jgi:DNA-directed RNA polymerase subunit F
MIENVMDPKLQRKLLIHLKHVKPYLAVILKAALQSLRQRSNPLRFCNAATGFRELLREFLSAIAPDDEILECHWFEPDSSAKNGITRRHRTLYAVYGYVGEAIFKKRIGDKVERLTKRLIKQVDKLSKFTHVTEDSLKVSASQAEEEILATVSLFDELITNIKDVEEVLNDELCVILSDELTDYFSNNVIDKLDILSTHTRSEYAESVWVKVESITPDRIEFSGDGSILCVLQYGSDGDNRRGDGWITSSNFPFTFEGSVTIDLKDFDIDESEIKVDTSSFYE